MDSISTGSKRNHRQRSDDDDVDEMVDVEQVHPRQELAAGSGHHSDDEENDVDDEEPDDEDNELKSEHIEDSEMMETDSRHVLARSCALPSSRLPHLVPPPLPPPPPPAFNHEDFRKQLFLNSYFSYAASASAAAAAAAQHQAMIRRRFQHFESINRLEIFICCDL